MAFRNPAFNPPLHKDSESTTTEVYHENKTVTSKNLQPGRERSDRNASEFDDITKNKEEQIHQQLGLSRQIKVITKPVSTQAKMIQRPSSEVEPTQEESIATQLDSRAIGEANTAQHQVKKNDGLGRIYGDPRCCMFNRKCLVVMVIVILFLLSLFLMIILLITGNQGTDHCLDSPCKNGGTCLSLEKDHYCVCASGWKGIKCTINIDECASNPCKNGGNCTDLVYDYNCSCTSTWYGKDCDIKDIDECRISHVCSSDAFCINTVGSYVYECIPGYYRNRQNVCTAVTIITVTHECYGTATVAINNMQTKGTLWSTNFPESYPGDNTCSWNLISQVNFSFTFNFFNTERWKDFVYIYDGGSTSAPLIGNYSGSLLPPSATSSSGELYIKFTSDGSNSKNGFFASFELTQSGSLRLAGGRYNYGRVEIYLNGEWGTICDRSWDINDANVSCRQLGFTGAVFAHRGAFYGQGSGRILLDNVRCSGRENHLIRCRHNGFGTHDCSHSNDAAVVCQPFIRLTDGGVNYGRVEIYYSGQWGTVCDDQIDTSINGAHVICRMLGFPSALFYYGGARYGPGSGPIWLDNVLCTGKEASITQCAHLPWGMNNCKHSADFSVYCNT